MFGSAPGVKVEHRTLSTTLPVHVASPAQMYSCTNSATRTFASADRGCENVATPPLPDLFLAVIVSRQESWRNQCRREEETSTADASCERTTAFASFKSLQNCAHQRSTYLRWLWASWRISPLTEERAPRLDSSHPPPKPARTTPHPSENKNALDVKVNGFAENKPNGTEVWGETLLAPRRIEVKSIETLGAHTSSIRGTFAIDKISPVDLSTAQPMWGLYSLEGGRGILEPVVFHHQSSQTAEIRLLCCI